MTPSMILGENSDAQLNLLLQLPSDRETFPLHPFLIISSVSMSKAECERVGSRSLDRPPSLSRSPSPSMYTFLCFFMDVEVGSCPDVVCPPAAPEDSILYSIINKLTGDRSSSSNTPNTLQPQRHQHLHLAPLFIFHAIRPETLSPSVFDSMAA